MQETMLTEPTYTVDIYMAGDIGRAKQVCREYCYAVGLCVSVVVVDYIYTGGEESGFKVGLLNYPRFPSDRGKIHADAEALARRLLDGCCQHSALLVSPGMTKWIARRPVDAHTK